MSDPVPEFWECKLMALLHDSPDKCFDIAGHERLAASFQQGAGFTDEEERNRIAAAVKAADHFASAAERFVFPKRKCATTFTGRPGESFVHPLASSQFEVGGDIRSRSGHIHEILKGAVNGISEDDWRKKHFLYWRRWLENAVSSDKSYAKDLAFLPADTRIPDHSIWNHMTVTSALAGCMEKGKVKPALLLFQLGPVQDFIAQARSTRDLWSGSYLLSWLMGHAMKAVSDQVGPDAVIFPNLRGNGIFDVLHREEIYGSLYADGKGGKDTLWDRMMEEKGRDHAGRWLLTPTLPNRFLAVVPVDRAEALAKAAEEAIRSELTAIGEAVWSWVVQKAGVRSEGWKARWDAQISAFPQTAWAYQPWLGREECLAAIKELPAAADENDPPYKRLCDMLALGEADLPEADRDARYYTNESKTKLRGSGILWSAHYALVDAKLAARRNTRDFTAWNNGSPESAVKDSLSGKEECVGDEAFWRQLAEEDEKLFTKSHCYGAMNLIKRLWCRSDKVPYLRDKLGIKEGQMGMALSFDSVPEIAAKNLKSKISNSSNPYVAILAMDGDDMGKWVSGVKTPALLAQLSASAQAYLEPILKAKGKTAIRRLLTPSYHLQFSEALANFATHLAGLVVEAHDGQLIYAGGDDVLAMLPASKAIECAEALRALFRGESPRNHNRYPLAVTQPGYVVADSGIPLIVPGASADASVGIAIGHQNAPLQMLVCEARNAEKHAKKHYEKSALAVSLYKRSGEIINWGCKWDSVALELMRSVTDLAAADKLSGRFPYALAGLLKPYALHGAMPDMAEVIKLEFRHVLSHQGIALQTPEADALVTLADRYLEQTAAHLEDFIGLFMTETFINRNRGEG